MSTNRSNPSTDKWNKLLNSQHPGQNSAGAGSGVGRVQKAGK